MLEVFPSTASVDLNEPVGIPGSDPVGGVEPATAPAPPDQAAASPPPRATVKPSSGASQNSRPDKAGSPAFSSVALEPPDLVPEIPRGIGITTPRDGHTLGSEAPPVVLVEGQVEDRSLSTVWLVANGRRITAHPRNGRFRQTIPVFESLLYVWAESLSSGGTLLWSRTVTVHAAAPWPRMIVLVMNWPPGAVGLEVEIRASWRANPERLDGPGEIVPLEGVRLSPDGAPAEVFYLRNWRPGAYTFVLSYRAPVPASDVRPTLYLPDAETLSARSLKPVSLNGTGTAVLAKVLLPYGVLWEEDEWFTGRGESAEAVTKFRFPEGITWTELKADLR